MSQLTLTDKPTSANIPQKKQTMLIQQCFYHDVYCFLEEYKEGKKTLGTCSFDVCNCFQLWTRKGTFRLIEFVFKSLSLQVEESGCFRVYVF